MKNTAVYHQRRPQLTEQPQNKRPRAAGLLCKQSTFLTTILTQDFPGWNKQRSDSVSVTHLTRVSGWPSLSWVTRLASQGDQMLCAERRATSRGGQTLPLSKFLEFWDSDCSPKEATSETCALKSWLIISAAIMLFQEHMFIMWLTVISFRCRIQRFLEA